MINIASKAGSYLRATNQVVSSGLKPLAGAAIAEPKKVVTDNRQINTLNSLNKAIPTCNLSVKSGVAGKLSVYNQF